jgi:hypothetical protein
MPLQDSHLQYIASGLEVYFYDLPVEIEIFKIRTLQLKYIFENGVAIPLGSPLFAKQTAMTDEDYELLELVANPQLKLNLENPADSFSVHDVEVALLDYAGTQLSKHFLEHNFPPEVAALWDISETKTKIAANKSVPFKVPRIEPALQTGTEGWELPPTTDRLYTAELVTISRQLSVDNFYVYLELKITIHLQHELLWPIVITEPFNMTNHTEVKEEIVRKCAMLAEGIVGQVLMLLLQSALTPQEMLTFSRVPAEGYSLDDWKEDGFNLLTYPFYFQRVGSKQLDPNLFYDLEPDTITSLRSQAVMDLQHYDIIDFTVAKMLPADLVWLFEVPIYLNAIIAQVIPITVFFELTLEQKKVLRLPCVINLQIRNSVFDFSIVKKLPLAGAQILFAEVYYLKLLNHQILFSSIEEITPQRRDILLDERLIGVLQTVNIITPAMLKMIYHPTYFELICTKKINIVSLIPFTEQQADTLIKYDISNLIQHNVLSFAEASALQDTALEGLLLSFVNFCLLGNKLRLTQVLACQQATLKSFDSWPQSMAKLIDNRFIPTEHNRIIALLVWCETFTKQINSLAVPPEEVDNNAHIHSLRLQILEVCDSDRLDINELLAYTIKRFFTHIACGITENRPQVLENVIQSFIAEKHPQPAYNSGHFIQTWAQHLKTVTAYAEEVTNPRTNRMCPVFFPAVTTQPQAILDGLRKISLFAEIVRQILYPDHPAATNGVETCELPVLYAHP